MIENTYTEKTHKTIINLVYLDDQVKDLEKFESELEDYEGDYKVENEFKLKTFTDKQIINIDNYLKNNKVDIFLCDHNMPEKKGLELITSMYVNHYPEITFIIYTGAINNKISIDCQNRGLAAVYKVGDFNTTIANIMWEYKKKNIDNIFECRIGNDTYDIIANELISGLKYINNKESFRIFIGSKELNIFDYYTHLKNKTEIGLNFVNDYYRGIKLFGLINNDRTK